jgi:hypothetical protein
MGKINMGRVILGGLVAGLIINASEYVLNMVVFGADMQAALTRANLSMPTNAGFVCMAAITVVVGIATIWLYAAARPRLGPGAKSATMIAVIVWAIGYFYFAAWTTMVGLFPSRMNMIGLLWGLAEMIIATNAGAYLYKEE